MRKGLLACDNFRMLHRFSIRWRSCCGNVITWQWEQQPKEYPGIRLRDLVPQRSSRFMSDASEMGSFRYGQWGRIRKAPLMAEAIRTAETLYWKEMQEGAQQTIDVNSGWVVLKLDVCARKRATSEYGKQYVASELKNIRPMRAHIEPGSTWSEKGAGKMFKSNNWSTLPEGKAQETFHILLFANVKYFEGIQTQRKLMQTL